MRAGDTVDGSAEALAEVAVELKVDDSVEALAEIAVDVTVMGRVRREMEAQTAEMAVERAAVSVVAG